MKRLFALATAFAVISCTKKEEATTTGPIVTTVGMISDVTREIVGDKREVINIIGEGTDPHVYKATKGDIDQIQAASLVLFNGLLLEGKMGSILDGKKSAHPVAENLEGVELIGGDDHADPHLWMDLSIWSKVAGRISEQVTHLDPDNGDLYQERLAAYQQNLTALHTYAQMVLSSIPPDQRVLVTAHDAFSYLGRAYGLEVRGIQGISTESEAGLNEIEDLVAYLVEKKIPSVFVESSVSDKSVQALIEGAAAQGHTVVIGGELYSDAMGPAGSYEGTYLGMMDHNITTIARSLGGAPPEKGFQNKLTK
ncbi:MAG: zinc ABC transporter substrate-binding protein [Akkermansiaceae bacterium]|jgi:manganese/zinc/iron transport system substrate-binding protein